MERQDFINTTTELKTMISSLRLTIDTLRQTINSQNATIASLQYHTLIETCKNVGLNVKEYFAYVFSRLIEGEKDYEKFLTSAVSR